MQIPYCQNQCPHASMKKDNADLFSSSYNCAGRRWHYLLLAVFALTALKSALAESVETGTTQQLRYAKNFSITHFQDHRVITVQSGNSITNQSHKYALVPKGKTLPELPENCLIVRTPVEQIVVLETIYIGFLEKLQRLDSIIGAGTTDYISNQTILQSIERGFIQKVKTAQTLDIERLLLLGPELIFTSVPSDPTFNIPAQLNRANLPVAITAEYREHHPLARAEWIKFIAAFFDASDEADEVFDAVASHYETLLKKVHTLENQPTVFCGAPYSGVWHIVKGESYMAQLIKDAGGYYLWCDVTGTETIPLDIERVFAKAANAGIWLNPSFHKSRQALLAANSRFSKFKAAQTGHIYNHTRQQTTLAGNPFWETGIIQPDQILADLIKILHPNQIPDREFVYYEQLK